jgi:hypothetical protein
MCYLLGLGKLFAQRIGQRYGGAAIETLGPVAIKFYGYHPVNSIPVAMPAIEAQLVPYKQKYQQACGDAYGKTEDIQKGKRFIPPEVSEQQLEVGW